jgi:hypothetical protein
LRHGIGATYPYAVVGRYIARLWRNIDYNLIVMGWSSKSYKRRAPNFASGETVMLVISTRATR